MKQASPPEATKPLPDEGSNSVFLELTGAGSFSGARCAGKTFKPGRTYEMTEKEAEALIATGLFSLKGSGSK